MMPDYGRRVEQSYSCVQRLPATLLINEEHDILAPVKATRNLYAHLIDAGVPVVMHILPQTDHAFDLIMPKISPLAHNAIYDVERFLALMVKSGNEVIQQKITPELAIENAERYPE
jgi:acetyl esterase/lipase